MTVSACDKMNVVFAGFIFVGGIHLLYIKLTVGNGRVAIFTGSYRRIGMQFMTCHAAYPNFTIPGF